MRRAHLAILASDGSTRAHPLAEASTTIGSAEDADVRLVDPEVAARHVRIDRQGDEFVVTRLSSPLLINGLRAKVHPLRIGDLLVVGGNALAVRAGDPPATIAVTDAPSAIDFVRHFREFTERLAAGDDEGALAERVLEGILALVGANLGTLVRFAAEADPIALRTARAPGFDEREQAFSRTVLARVLDLGRGIVIPDTRNDALLGDATSVAVEGGRAIVAAPITNGDRTIGALYVSGPPGTLGEGALEIVSFYAERAVDLLEREAKERALVARLDDLGEAPDASPILGSSPKIRSLRSKLRKIAQSGLPLLIAGETGTGKELVAREVHRLGPRARGPFVAINCGAIPPELVGSELFGHVRGAFTQAHRDRLGAFRSAEGGTLFLDEIAEMPLAQQVVLLRVLQERRLTPIGADSSVMVDVRIVCASHRDLEAEVAAGRFRSDLYFRIAGVTIAVPPLREREGDAVELALHFLSRERREGGRAGLQFAPGALAAIRRAPWPGNVRELEAAVRKAAVLVEGDTIVAADLGFEEGPADPAAIEPLLYARDEFLKRYVRDTVERFGGNRTAAAEALRVSVRTVFKYLEEV